MLSIFAGDSDGRYFGTIGGVGELGGDEDCYPVGYIDSKGKHAKIAGSFKEFMELVVFYPYWKDIVRYEEIEVDYDIDEIRKKQKNESTTQYFANQIEIAQTLNLSKNPQSIELLLSNIRSSPGFVIYSSIDKARKTNIFIEDYMLSFTRDN